jgi:Arc/MetJ family transcription regulator
MRTTINIEDELLDKAAKLTGIKEKTSLVRLGLEALIKRESAKRLAKLGGN